MLVGDSLGRGPPPLSQAASVEASAELSRAQAMGYQGSRTLPRLGTSLPPRQPEAQQGVTGMQACASWGKGLAVLQVCGGEITKWNESERVLPTKGGLSHVFTEMS